MYYQQSKKRGQTMAEYIIIVALVAVLSIPLITMLGDVFRDRVINIADEMIDNKAQIHEEGRSVIEQAKTKRRRTLSSFGK